MKRPRPSVIVFSAAGFRRNYLVLIAAGTAVSIIALNYNPTPIGIATPRDRDGAMTSPAAMLAETVEQSSTSAAAAQTKVVPHDPTPHHDDPHMESEVVTGREALKLNLKMLERGYQKLQQTKHYTATFIKRERVRGELYDEEVVQMKVRHQPFSVYMKWMVGDKGREALYVTGKHDDKLLVHYGGWKARLTPTLKLEPDSSLAMMWSRYPITHAGILKLAQTLIAGRRRDLRTGCKLRCEMIDNQQYDERDCYRFVLEYDSPKACKTYRKSIAFIDKGLLLPIWIKNFTWPDPDTQLAAEDLDESTLIEHYTYSNISLDAEFVDTDFAPANKAYQFRR